MRIPNTDSIRELAEFWDTHDLTELEGALEEVSEPVFAQRMANAVRIPLSAEERRAIREIAASRGVEEVVLVGEWLRETPPLKTWKGPLSGREEEAREGHGCRSSCAPVGPTLELASGEPARYSGATAMRSFNVVVERDPDTGLYVGHVPGWPGAHSQGQSLDELQRNLQEVVAMLLEDGDPRLESEFVGVQTIKVA